MEIERQPTKEFPDRSRIGITCSECGFCFNADRGYVWVGKTHGDKKACYDCAEKNHKVRKEEAKPRFDKDQLSKATSEEDINTPCHQCGKRSSEWILSHRDSQKIYGFPHKRHICSNCIQSVVVTRQQYGFYIRFASEDFVPCTKCQDELHEMLMTRYWNIYTSYPIKFSGTEGKYDFELLFLVPQITSQIPMNPQKSSMFRPCEDCQKKLQSIIGNKELHIGSEVKPPVELWRRMQVVEEYQQ